MEGKGITFKIQVRPESLATNLLECSLYCTYGDLSDRVLKTDDLHGVVITQRFQCVRAIQRPKCGKSTLLQETVKICEVRKEAGERVWFVHVGI